jgi:1,4-alpha-glucan branching enzyme
MAGTVSVVGDFNDWQSGVTPFRGRGSVRSAMVEVEPGRRYSYLADGGTWFNDAESDDYAPNHQGVLDGVVDLISTGAGDQASAPSRAKGASGPASS